MTVISLLDTIRRTSIQKGFGKAGARRKRILLATFPKSGSSYLYTMIGNLPGFMCSDYTPANDRREQEICGVILADGASNRCNQVARHHVRASEHTLALIERYELILIVLVRNIYDVIVSVADHIRQDSIVSPIAFFDDRIAKLPIGDRIDAVVDLAVPWYFNFYVSWWRARPQAFVTYEDVVLGGVGRQVDFLGRYDIRVTEDDVSESVAKARSEKQLTRFNVGRGGRGADLVGPEHVAKIERLASYYPDVDFRPMGLSRQSRADSSLARIIA